jgi:hypothetical protein
MVEVYVDDFMSLVIPVSREQLHHVANAIMHGIHDVFPPDNNDDEDPISEKKMKKGEGLYDTEKTLLGFDFDGDAKTMWLESAKREKLLTILKGWIRTGKRGSAESRLEISSQPLQRYGMRFRASLRGVVYYRLATAFSRSAHHIYICNGMWQYSRRWRGVEPSSVNLPKNQHGVENWSLDGLIISG